MQVLAADDGALTLRRWSKTESRWDDAQAERLRARDDGHRWPDGSATVCYRFQAQAVPGHRYLIGHALSANALYWGENPMEEWMPLVDAPLHPAWQARVGSQWRYVSDSPDSIVSCLPPPMIRSIDELAERGPSTSFWTASNCCAW